MAQGRIVLGVCGGIAAYKSVYLLRLLKRAGYDVQVVATPEALQFVGAVTWASLSGQAVLTGFFDPDTGAWNQHVHLAQQADRIVVAPLTAHTLAKWASGHCDNLLLAILQSTTAPVFAAPAMDREMYRFPANQENLEKLKRWGVRWLPPDSGPLASGLEGEGRMAEPEFIFDRLEAFAPDLPSLEGRRVLITAGPTWEFLDPVRYMTNASSGRMAVALAHAFRNAGARVHLVCGPMEKNPPHDCTIIRVQTAAEMLQACKEIKNDWDIFVGAAAVSDFAFVERASEKIKKEHLPDHVAISTNPDIVASMAADKTDNQLVVGFALESENVQAHAIQKLKRKNLDMIVANSAAEEGAGLTSETNHVWLLDRHSVIEIPKSSKNKIAVQLVKHIAQYYFDRLHEQKA